MKQHKTFAFNSKTSSIFKGRNHLSIGYYDKGKLYLKTDSGLVLDFFTPEELYELADFIKTLKPIKNGPPERI